jgi:hypothetical protein
VHPLSRPSGPVAMYQLPRLEELSNLDEATQQAYSSVFLHEQWAASQARSRQRKLTCARVLGRLLLEAPSTRARQCIIGEVDACEHNNDRLYQLGGMYLDHFIRLCVCLRYFLSLCTLTRCCRQFTNTKANRQYRSAIPGACRLKQKSSG